MAMATQRTKMATILPTILAVALAVLPAALGAGLTCEEHPGYIPGMKPVFVHSFKKLAGTKHTRMGYHPRYAAHHWYPLDNPSSTKYKNLDWFWSDGDDDAAGSDAYIRLFLQRPAKAYLAVAADWDPDFPESTLPGWTSEGYAERTDGGEEDFVFGVQQRSSRWLPERVYIFSKPARGMLDLPEHEWVKAKVRGMTSSGSWYLMLAEPNGDAPAPPASPPGVGEVEPNKPCPAALHNLWMTKNTDDADEDTKGKKWRTWHPMWDPCHWCGYDHEHGSSPKKFMGYEPKYGYVAWKNGREDEDHRGFKGHVFRYGAYLIYWSLHVQTSSLRRLSTRLHSITFVVVHAGTKELLIEVNHKGFFGFLAVRTDEDFMALTPREQEMRDALTAQDYMRNKRSVNVIDMDNLDPRFEYRMPRSNTLRGEYEDWTTGPLCAMRGRHGMITTDTTNPASGIKSIEEQTKVTLGFYHGDDFLKSDGSSRIVILNDFEIGYDHCVFKLKNIKGGFSDDGVFYTDARGTTIVAGAAPEALKQFVKPGFTLSIPEQHVFEPVDVWFGWYENEGERGTSSYGFPIDPEGN